jgi:hypothetical protein
MPTAHRYGNISGLRLTESTWIGFRYDPHYGFDHRRMESWVMATSGTRTPSLVLRCPGRLTEPWRSPSGVTFAPSYSGDVHVISPPVGTERARVRTDELEGVLTNAWGLSDDLVFVWGIRRWTERGGENVMYRWDGRSWSGVTPPSPGPETVHGMHGVRPDLIYAVGRGGLIARWDGHAWTRAASPTGSVLSRVLVVDETRMYANGPGRRLLEGSLYGWTQILTAKFGLNGLALRAGGGGADGAGDGDGDGASAGGKAGEAGGGAAGEQLWVASYSGGLWKVDGTALAPINEDISIAQWDARGEEIVMTTQDEILATTDGKKLTRIGLALFMRLHEMYGDQFPLVGRPPPGT